MWEIIWEELNLCITWFAALIKLKSGDLWWTFSSKRENRCHFYGKNRNSALHIALGFKQHKWTEQKHRQGKRICVTALWKHFLLQSRYLYWKCESTREILDSDRFPEALYSLPYLLSSHPRTSHLQTASLDLQWVPGIHRSFPLTLLSPWIM